MFHPISIIHTEDLETADESEGAEGVVAGLSAVYVVERVLKIENQKQRVLMDEAKKLLYSKGF